MQVLRSSTLTMTCPFQMLIEPNHSFKSAFVGHEQTTERNSGNPKHRKVLLMRTRCAYIAIVVASLMWSPAAISVEQVPKQLGEQVERLVMLLSDGYAVGYPKATMYRPLGLKTGGEVVLVIFTVEGWGGGNSFTQFLAVFSKGTDDKEKEYFTFIDAMPVGSGGWRQVEQLDVNTLPSKTKGESLFSIKVKVNAEQDPPNFPSKRSIAVISLKEGKLKEVGSR